MGPTWSQIKPTIKNATIKPGLGHLIPNPTQVVPGLWRQISLSEIQTLSAVARGLYFEQEMFRYPERLTAFNSSQHQAHWDETDFISRFWFILLQLTSEISFIRVS